MIFVFDWGHQTFNDVGPLSIQDFQNPFKSEMVWLSKRRTWFRAVFIPAIPTKLEYGVLDEDGKFATLDEETFAEFRHLAVLNKRFSEGHISEDEYLQEREKLGF